MRAVGYVDGMNFYEASKDKQWYPAGWCNWRETVATYCPGADVSVCYFTTLYTGKDQTRVRRQKLHLRAMEEVARAEIIYGSCRERPIKCPECKSILKCRCGCERRFAEKMTDVNIAVRLLEDAIDGMFNRAYVVTSDVDLAPAVYAALRRAPNSQIFILLPPDTVMVEEFAALGRQYPGRSKAEYLDLNKMRRFPDDLPKRWNLPFPKHWRQDAGRRPSRPEQEITKVPHAKRTASWADESTGYGTKDVARDLLKTPVSHKRS